MPASATGCGCRAGSLLTPFGGYGQMGSGRRLQVGANLGSLGLFGGDLDSPVQVEFVGERYGRPGAGADHRVTLFGIINLGQSPRPACGATTEACAGAGAATAGAPGGEAEPPPAPQPAALGPPALDAAGSLGSARPQQVGQQQ